jgi:hypothetical protein
MLIGTGASPGWGARARCAALVVLLCAAVAAGQTEGAKGAPVVQQDRHTGAGDATLDVQLTLDRVEMTVAERLIATLTVSARPDASLTLPTFSNTLGDFTIVSSESKARIEGPLLRTTVRYVLEPFLAGDKQIPTMEIRALDGKRTLTLRTEPVSIKVGAVAGTGDTEKTPLEPARGPVALIAPKRNDLRRPIWVGVVSALVGTVASMGVVALQRRRARRLALPINRVRRELDALSLALGSSESREEAAGSAARLREALATFLHGHFGLPAPTSTARELDAALASSQLFQQDRDSLAALLEELDRARFGPGGVTAPVVRGLLERVRVWVEAAAHLPAVKGGAR